MKLQTRARPQALKESIDRRQLGQPIMAGQKEKPAGVQQSAGPGCTNFPMFNLSSLPRVKKKKQKNLVSLMLGQKPGQGLQSVSLQVYCKHQETAVQRSLWRAGRAQSPPNHPTEENLPAKVQSNQYSKHSPRRKTNTKH